jgi:multicomponent Na+:H+ antiporter subunit D
MTFNVLLPLLVVASSFVTGLLIFFLPEHKAHTRSALNMAGATLKLVLVLIMCWGVYRGEMYEFRFSIVLGFDFVLKVDLLSLLLVTLSSVLWFFTTIYAIGYLEGSPNRSRFFGFFSLCVTASVGVAMAGNLITFFIFYEFLTLSTYPLVVHRGTEESLQAGRKYLWYTMAGGAVLFVGVVWLHVLVGALDFQETGFLRAWPASLHGSFTVIFFLLIIGLGVKAALFPLHGWLPVAMVAPAPVSALLHAVAVVKAGAFGIVRVVYDVFGVEFASDLGLLTPLTIATSFTIVYGSVRALTQDDLKRRLAFSTVSQVSYIALGVSVLGLTSSIGGLVHLVHQGLMKITLFFCAGIYAESLSVKTVSGMKGIGRRMPITTAAFTIAAFGMIGVPPVAGFASKWHLGLGALESGQPWVIGILLTSTLLNAGYFLPILYAAWFQEQEKEWGHAHHAPCRYETPMLLLFPAVVTALLSLLTGMFAGAGWSPLALARAIALREYVP